MYGGPVQYCDSTLLCATQAMLLGNPSNPVGQPPRANSIRQSHQANLMSQTQSFVQAGSKGLKDPRIKGAVEGPGNQLMMA